MFFTDKGINNHNHNLPQPQIIDQHDGDDDANQPDHSTVRITGRKTNWLKTSDRSFNK